MKNVYKWRIVTNKYLYLTDENNAGPFIFNKVTKERIYECSGTPQVDDYGVDEGKISQIVSEIRDAHTYEAMFNNMVNLAMCDSDAQKLHFLTYDNYFNLDSEECVQEAVTPKCEGYEPVFKISAHTIDDTEVSYTFFPERNEQDKTLRYNLDLGIPRGLTGEKGEAGESGCQGAKGDDGKSAVIVNADATVYTLPVGSTPEAQVEVVPESATTEDENQYVFHFNFGVPQGSQGERGVAGRTGANGKDAIITDAPATIDPLEYGQQPQVSVSAITTPTEEENQTELLFHFDIPAGPQGEVGPAGAPSVIHNAYVANIETLDPGEQAWVTVTASTAEESANSYDLVFDFGIPRGADGSSGGGGGGIYNFENPVKDLSGNPVGSFTVTELADGTRSVELTLWNSGGGGTPDIKHRYDGYVDSLSEGVQDTINNVSYPKAIASGVRSHAEGIGGSGYLETFYGYFGPFNRTLIVDNKLDGTVMPIIGGTIIIGNTKYTVTSANSGSDLESRHMIYDNVYVTAEGSTEAPVLLTNTYSEQGLVETYHLTDVTIGFSASERPNAIGIATHTEGKSTTAEGNYSHAEGENTRAVGKASHAEGIGADGEYIDVNMRMNCSGDLVFEKWDIPAGYNLSTITGATFTVKNESDLNDGYKDIVNKSTIFMIDGATAGSGEANHFWFSNVTVKFTDTNGETHNNVNIYGNGGLFTNDIGHISYSYGYYLRLFLAPDDTGAYGEGSHVEGGFNKAFEDYSHAEGWSTMANGVASHAEGGATVTSGDYSHAGGYGTVADKDYMTAIGKFNATGETGTLFAVGDGVDGSRSNVFSINGQTKKVALSNNGGGIKFQTGGTSNLVWNTSGGTTDLNTFVPANTIPVGTIQMYAGSTAPVGWLLCTGGTVSRTTYSDLFNVCGTIYGGGDGSTTFNIPDLQQRFPLGTGTNHVLSSTGGTETVTLSENEMPSHTHYLATDLNQTDGTGYVNGETQVTLRGAASGSPWVVMTSDRNSGAGNQTYVRNLRYSDSVGDINADGLTTSDELYIKSSGSGQPHNNMPPFLAINFIIKY